MSLDPSVIRIFGNMENLEKYYYEGEGIFESPGQRFFAELLQKQAPHLTTTAGIYQVVYGKRVWGQLNYEANAFAILAKRPWDRSGWRVKTAKAATSGGGVAEGATLPVTIKAAYAPVSTKPKIHVNTWEASELLDLLSQVDDAVDILEVGREDAGLTHRDLLNKNLLTDVDTPAGNQIESIDRVCSGYPEQALVSTPSDVDIYGLDRHTGATWADANILHNSNVDRDLSLALIDQLFRSIHVASGETPDVVLTGYDTLFAWGALLQSQNRYFGNAMVQPTFAGVRTATPGVEGAFNVATYFDRPIITSKDVLVDTISRIYMLNSAYLFAKTLKPTRYFETSDPFVINTFGTRGLYETVAELICTFFKAQGKIRDLK